MAQPVSKQGATAHIEDPDATMAADVKETGVNEAQPEAEEFPPVEQLGLWKGIKKYRYASIICVLAAVGVLSDGYQVQMSGSIVALDGFIRQFGDLQDDGNYKIDPQYLALWGSLKNVAAMIGGVVGSYPADIFGRRWTILAVQVIMIGACVLEQLSTHWTHWLGARLMDGFSIGLAQCSINVYISEMAPTACRGALMSLVQLFYSLGSFLSSISLQIVSVDKPSNWRHAVLSQFAISGAAIIAWIFLPESIRWHGMNGREDEAKNIMRKVNKSVEGYDVDLEYRRMMVEVHHLRTKASQQSGGSYIDVFRGSNFRRLVISFLPWHWQVAMGVPIIGTYSSYFFDMAGLANPFLGTIATNIINIAMLILAVPLVERLGRRTMLLSFSPIAICSLLIMGGVLRTDGPAVGPVLITFACTWGVGYSLSAGPMGYIFVAETATTSLRAKTTGVAIFFIQGMATVYVYIAPIMLNAPALGMSNTVFFFVGTGTLVYILVFFLVPETKGRTFAELDELFDRGVPAWKFSKAETSESRRREEEQRLAGEA